MAEVDPDNLLRDQSYEPILVPRRGARLGKIRHYKIVSACRILGNGLRVMQPEGVEEI